MKLLPDTCALIWLVSDRERLSERARELIDDEAHELVISATSAFEIGTKYRKWKLSLAVEPDVWWPSAIAQHRIEVLPITDAVALAATALPQIHRDPCDRIILAEATQQGASILANDPLFAQYPTARVVW